MGVLAWATTGFNKNSYRHADAAPGAGDALFVTTARAGSAAGAGASTAAARVISDAAGHQFGACATDDIGEAKSAFKLRRCAPRFFPAVNTVFAAAESWLQLHKRSTRRAEADRQIYA